MFSLKGRAPSNSKKPKVEIKAGVYTGRIVQVIGIGVHPQTSYDDDEEKEKAPKEEFIVTVEFPKIRIETDEGDKPVWISRRFKVVDINNDYYQNSAVYKMLDMLMDDYSLESLLNKPCMCGIGFTKNGNPKITSMTPTPDGLEVPELEGATKIFDPRSATPEEFHSLYPWQQTVIQEALDFPGSDLERLLEAID